MKLKVVKQFKDKNDHKTIYQVGDVINIKEIERVTNLIKRDLCIPMEEEKEATAAEEQPKTNPTEEQPKTAPAEEKPKRGTRKSDKAESKKEE